MMYPFKTGQSNSIKDSKEEMQRGRHFGKKRRKGWGLLAYYLAGGSEHRYQTDRRYSQEEVDNEFTANPGKRIASDRRCVVNTKYLNCGKIMDRREDVRRSNDHIDETAVEYEKFQRLGPGWLS
jgi:hypothetical protein